MPRIRVRPAEDRDYKAMYAVMAEARGLLSQNLKREHDLARLRRLGDLHPRPLEEYTEWRHECLVASAGDGFLVATVRGKIAGYALAFEHASGFPPKRQALLGQLWVVPAYQGTGVGTALWDASTEYLWSLGYDEAFITFLADTEPVRRFLERMGAWLYYTRTDGEGEEAVRAVVYRVDLGSMYVEEAG